MPTLPGMYIPNLAFVQCCTPHPQSGSRLPAAAGTGPRWNGLFSVLVNRTTPPHTRDVNTRRTAPDFNQTQCQAPAAPAGIRNRTHTNTEAHQPMTATITETALDTGRKIHAKTANAHRIAAILDVPPGLQTSAIAGMIITLGMALAPNTRWKEKSVTVKRLRRVASNDSIPRPRPLHYMAANLLDAIDARGTGTLSDSFQHQAQLCREQTADTAAALEQLTPMREETSVFHTTGPAATLMAHLTVPGHLDWSKPASLAALTITDYACGHGALLASVYQRARDLHRAAGGDPARLHSQMMEKGITYKAIPFDDSSPLT